MTREKFGSRLGFILISAGCAIGLGNVYRFPIITGSYGGALFVLIYLAFLCLLGIPVMCAELSVGRASQRSPLGSGGSRGPWALALGYGPPGPPLCGLPCVRFLLLQWLIQSFRGPH